MFLLFRSSNIHYSSQVQGIPDPKGAQMLLGGLVRDNPAQEDPTAVTSPTGVVEAQKMISRYCLLSWTMCYNTFRGPLAKKKGTSKQLLDMGLLHDRELLKLQVTNNHTPDFRN